MCNYDSRTDVNATGKKVLLFISGIGSSVIGLRVLDVRCLINKLTERKEREEKNKLQKYVILDWDE